MQKAVTPTSVKAAYHDSSETVQNRVYKSLKVWSMYADLEESFGTFKVRINSHKGIFCSMFVQSAPNYNVLPLFHFSHVKLFTTE